MLSPRIVLAGLLATLPIPAFQPPDPCAAASTASDIQFELALKDHGSTFQSGEIVPLALRFTSPTEGRYNISLKNYDRSGRLGEETYCVEPAAVDPVESYFRAGILRGGGMYSMGELGAKPVLLDAELNEWWNLAPGHYRLYAISHRVTFRPDEQSHTANVQSVAVRSNVVEFEVLPPDPDWQTAQLRTAVAALAGSAPAEQQHAARVLRFLNTEASTRELARLFDGGVDMVFGLYGSPFRQVAIDAMFGEFKAPDHAISPLFLQTLVNLEITADHPWDPPKGVSDAEAVSFFARRRAHTDELMASALQRLAAAVGQKQGAARATTLEALLSAGADSGAVSPGVRAALLREWQNLPAQLQHDLVEYRWPLIAGAEMAPILRKMLVELPADANARTLLSMTRDAVLQHLFELDPAAARDAILADLRNENAQPSMETIALLPKEDREAAVSPALRRMEENRAQQLDFDLVDRYAGAEAIPVVQGMIAHHDGYWNCPVQAALLRYLLRVAPAEGAAAVRSVLAARSSDGCYRNLLVDLGGQLSNAQAVAVAALEDGERQVAQSAAQALGRWGSKEAEAALWERLRKFHAEWAGRQDELRSARNVQSAAAQAASFEDDLASAIAKGTNWICPPEKLDRLAELTWAQGTSQSIAGWRRNWDRSPVLIESNWSLREIPTFSVWQYERLNEEQLIAKLSQMPQAELRWHFWKTGEISPAVTLDRQEQVFERVRSALAAMGRNIR